MTGQQKTLITLAVLLALSVCGNAFMGGLLIGGPHGHDHMMRDDDGPAPGDGREMGRGAREFLRDLPPDVREQFAASMRDNRQEVMTGMRRVMQARKESQATLTAENFDAQALRDALKAQRDAQAQVQQKIHEQMVGVIEKLTPDQRAQIGQSARKLFR